MFLNLSDIVDMILFVSEAKLSEDSFSEWNPRVCVFFFFVVFF